MSTAIEWAEETWNPVTGCTKVSPGCDHCYAERITNRWGGPRAFDTVVLHEDRLSAPLKRRTPTTWFVNSMSDLFHDDVPDEFIVQVFAVMAVTEQHTYQILTKRPGRMASLLRRMDADEEFDTPRNRAMEIVAERAAAGHRPEFPLPNVWLGTSVEDQKWADVRVPLLMATPAAVRFLSCEPLLGPTNLRFLAPRAHGLVGIDALLPGSDASIGWVIVGGESGPGARPMDPVWARSLRDQCVAANVPFFFKQWGGRTPKAGGRLLDGQTWDEMPERLVANA